MKKINKKFYKDFCALSKNILRLANKGVPIIDFLIEFSKMFFRFSYCDEIEIIMHGNEQNYHWIKERKKKTYQFKFIPFMDNIKNFFKKAAAAEISPIALMVFQEKIDSSLSCFSKNGSFWIGDTSKPLFLNSKTSKKQPEGLTILGKYKTISIIRFIINDNNIGLLIMKSKTPYFFTARDIEYYEGVIQTLGVAIADRRTQAALRERIKELTCLYGIAKILEESELSLDIAFNKIVNIIPPAVQFPEIASARIVLEKKSFKSQLFKETSVSIKSYIIEKNIKVGKIEVFYNENKKSDEDIFFIPEEKELIETIAKQVSVLIERRKRAEEKEKLQDQLRHADRLATIGQLAAGVAHELNEPLGNVLGYAQLIKKDSEINTQVKNDIEVIIKAPLHAREVIKKLMYFAKQLPPRNLKVDLNNVIEDGIYFLESRCDRAGIDLKKELKPHLPKIPADASQLNQVLVNLIVNSIQAMPAGGEILIKTYSDKQSVYLIIKDNGIGMDKETLEKIFIPFFTTKDINEGTGLGLPVVHGIIKAHRGNIKVESKLGKGTVSTVTLPRKTNRRES